MTTVVIADPLSVFRVAVRRVLERERDFTVREARDLESLEAAVAGGVDIAVLDGALPPAGALAAIPVVRPHCEHVIVWGLRPTGDVVLEAIRAGARGYLRKESSCESLVRSLRAAAAGEPPLARDLVGAVIDALRDSEARVKAHERVASLSQREREVLAHVANGARNKQIANALTISEFTVKRHVQNILEKLDLPTRRAAATYYAATAGRAEHAAR